MVCQFKIIIGKDTNYFVNSQYQRIKKILFFYPRNAIAINCEKAIDKKYFFNNFMHNFVVEIGTPKFNHDSKRTNI